MTALIERWDRFWFRPGHTLSLGLFRILFGLCLWKEVTTTHIRSRFAIDGGFHIPYLEFLEPMSREMYDWVHRLEYLPIFLVIVGLFTRPALVTLLGLQGLVFFTDQMNFRNHPYFFLLVLLVLLFSPCDESLSVRRWWRLRRGASIPHDAYLGAIRPLAAQRLIMLQISLVYAFAAIHKTNGWYLSGAGLSKFISRDLLDDFSGDFFRTVLPLDWVDRMSDWVAEPANLIPMAVGTVIVEAFLAFGLWSRRTRPLAIACGVALHVGIAFVMNIKTFSYAMLGSYLLFLEPETLPRWLSRSFGEGDVTIDVRR